MLSIGVRRNLIASHLFWIPLVPLGGKHEIARCGICGWSARKPKNVGSQPPCVCSNRPWIALTRAQAPAKHVYARTEARSLIRRRFALYHLPCTTRFDPLPLSPLDPISSDLDCSLALVHRLATAPQRSSSRSLALTTRDIAASSLVSSPSSSPSSPHDVLLCGLQGQCTYDDRLAKLISHRRSQI